MTTGVVLAAGRSSRAGCIKALSELRGRTFLQRAIDMLTEGGCTSVMVVVGPPHERAIRNALPEACFFQNREPGQGMLSSLQVGLAGTDNAGEKGDVVVALVDQPRIAARTVRLLIEASFRSGASWLQPTHLGHSGHPILLRPAAISRLRDADPKQSPRDVLRTLTREWVPVDDAFVLEDVDTAAGLERLRAHGTC